MALNKDKSLSSLIEANDELIVTDDTMNSS
jgi:hypothetical protein